MKRLLFMFGIIFFLTSLSPMLYARTDYNKTKDISITINPEKIQEEDSPDYLIIKDPQSEKEWKMSYGEFNKLFKSRKNWVVVESNTPEITEIYEEGNFIYIVFGYYDKVEKDFLGFKYNKDETVLSGKVLIHKKYLLSPDAHKCNVVFYQGLTIGFGVYSLITTILLAIIIF